MTTCGIIPSTMSLRKIHIEKLSHLIAAHLHEMGLAKDVSMIELNISGVLTKNMDDERALIDEAHKLLDKNRKTFGMDIDEQKALIMIKKQLAKQKNFVL